MTSYVVTVTREDDLWITRASTADGQDVGVLDFDSFTDLHEVMPEYIADMTNDVPAEVDVEWRYDFNGRDVTDPLRQFRAATEHLRRTQQEQERAGKQALAAMVDAGLSQRVMADVVELSHQRINQLIHS